VIVIHVNKKYTKMRCAWGKAHDHLWRDRAIFDRNRV